MLKASWLVPLGTPETVKAGEFDPQAATPVHEKFKPMASAVEGNTLAAIRVPIRTVRVWVRMYVLQRSTIKNDLRDSVAKSSGRLFSKFIVQCPQEIERFLFVFGPVVVLFSYGLCHFEWPFCQVFQPELY